MKKYLKHLGSTIALTLGILILISALAEPANFHINKMINGFMIIIGALAYRSAKKRKLGEVKNTSSRKSTEIGKIIVMIAPVLFRNDLKHFVATQPAEALTQIIIIPLWVIIAYSIMALKVRKANKEITGS